MIQVFRKNVTQMGLLPTLTLAIAHRMTRTIQSRATSAVMSTGSTSRRPGNTAGAHITHNQQWPFEWTITLRYAPHDTAHLIELMGGNVSVVVLENVWYVGLTRLPGNLYQTTWSLLRCQSLSLFLLTIPHGTDSTRLDIILLEMNHLSKCVLWLF